MSLIWMFSIEFFNIFFSLGRHKKHFFSQTHLFCPDFFSIWDCTKNFDPFQRQTQRSGREVVAVEYFLSLTRKSQRAKNGGSEMDGLSSNLMPVF